MKTWDYIGAYQTQNFKEINKMVSNGSTFNFQPKWHKF